MKLYFVKNSVYLVCGFLLLGCGSKVPFTRGTPNQADEKLVSGSASLPNEADFERYVRPVMEQNCAACHDNPAADYATALSLVKAGRPAESELYLRATGQKSHPKVLAPESQQARNIEDWINSSPAVAKPEVPQPAVPQAPTIPPKVNAACVVVAETEKQICEEMFAARVLPDLIKSCDRCHDNPAPNYPTALTLIKPGAPLESDIYLRAIGEKSHKKVWLKDSASAKNLESWITGN